MKVLEDNEFATTGIELEVLPAAEGSDNTGFLSIAVAKSTVRAREDSFLERSGVRLFTPDNYISRYAARSEASEGYDLLIGDNKRSFSLVVEKTYGAYIPEAASYPVVSKIDDTTSFTSSVANVAKFMEHLYGQYKTALQAGKKGILLNDAISSYNSDGARYPLLIGDEKGMFLEPESAYERGLEAYFALTEHRFDRGIEPDPSFYLHYNTSMPLGVMYSDIYEPLVGKKMSLPLKEEFSGEKEWPSCYPSRGFSAWEKKFRLGLQAFISRMNPGGPDPYGRVEGALRAIIYGMILQLYYDISPLLDKHFPPSEVYKTNKDYFSMLPKTDFDDIVAHCLSDTDKEELLQIIGRTKSEHELFLINTYGFLSRVLGVRISKDTVMSIVIAGDESVISIPSFFDKAVIKPAKGERPIGMGLIFKTVAIEMSPRTKVERLSLPIFEVRVSNEHPIKLRTINEQVFRMHSEFINFALKYADIYNRNGVLVRPPMPELRVLASAGEDEIKVYRTRRREQIIKARAEATRLAYSTMKASRSVMKLRSSKYGRRKKVGTRKTGYQYDLRERPRAKRKAKLKAA